MKLVCKQCNIELTKHLIKLQNLNLLNDLINSKHHSDASCLNGCCALDGLDGLKILQINFY